MNGKAFVIILVIALVALVGWYLFANSDTDTGSPNPITATTSTAGTASTPPQEVTITYTSQGFVPKSVTIPSGTTVTFDNEGGGDMWVASAPHPTHERYDGTTESQHCASNYAGPEPFDQCAIGTRFTFAFTKSGTWAYHNHRNATSFGTIIVSTSTAP